MFELQIGIVLALISRIALAKNIKQLVGPPSPTEFSIGHFVQYKQGVIRCSSRQGPLVLL
jgi:hypothetical protein